MSKKLMDDLLLGGSGSDGSESEDGKGEGEDGKGEEEAEQAKVRSRCCGKGGLCLCRLGLRPVARRRQRTYELLAGGFPPRLPSCDAWELHEA